MDHLGDESVALALLPPEPPIDLGRWFTKPVVLLLIMKLLGNAFEYQLITFNIDAYVNAHANRSTDDCVRLPYQQQSDTYSPVLVLVAASIFLLPTLGGIISDRHFGCVKVLIGGCMVQFWASILFPTFIWMSLMCHSHIWFYIIACGLALSLGLVDPLLVYALMQNAKGTRGRSMLIFAYFVAAAGTECLGNLPKVLRYIFKDSTSSESFEFLGILYSATLVICTFLLSSDGRACERLRNENFEFPVFKRLQRYYIIVAGFIPFAAAIVLCRNIFYWKEIKYYTKDERLIGSAIPMSGYQLATIGFSLIGAVLTAKGKFPKSLTIRVRIQSGLLLMLTCKTFLFILSFFHTKMSELGQSHPAAVQIIYFAAAFTDGAANAMTDVAMYELVDCVAERCAKAMYIGIFYTTWGLGLMLTGIIVIILRKLPSEGTEMFPQDGVQPQFYIRYAIIISLLLLSFAYFIKVALPLAEPLILTNIEENLQEMNVESRRSSTSNYYTSAT